MTSFFTAIPDLFFAFLALGYATLSIPVSMTISISGASLAVLALVALPLSATLALLRGWTMQEFLSTTVLWSGGFAVGGVVLALGNSAAMAPLGPLEGMLLGVVRGALGGAVWLLPRVALAGP